MNEIPKCTNDPFEPKPVHHEQLDRIVSSMGTGQTLRVQPAEGWTEEDMRSAMKSAGLIDIKPYADYPACQFGFEGTKPMISPRRRNLSNVQAIMSMPRLAFSANMFSAVNVGVRLGLKFEKVEGVFWGQCLERSMSAYADKNEYILTIDYDTVFNEHHVLALLDLMEKYPDVAAIAPSQIKRDGNAVLFVPISEDGTAKLQPTLADFDGDLTRVASAHFGLTLIRTSALKTLPHPWFKGEPNAQGRWEEGRVDDDIYFWNKIREAGHKVCVANHVSVGHVQLVVTWPNNVFEPVHQFMSDWNANGVPAGVRK